MKDKNIDPAVSALILRCNGRLDDMVIHIITAYESGACCVYCDHSGHCEEQSSPAVCGKALAEYIRRMED